ncbi:MAG: winged helix-turn-helix domain-containing protein [Bradymonadia bacterium]
MTPLRQLDDGVALPWQRIRADVAWASSAQRTLPAVNARVMIVERDLEVGQALVDLLERHGYVVAWLKAVRECVARARRRPLPDLVILGEVAPEARAVDLCRGLRDEPETRDVRVMFMPLHCEEIDRVVAFEVGADDFVQRPYSPHELPLRIRAVLRRGAQGGARAVDAARDGIVRIDREGHRVSVDGRPVDLTPQEIRMLNALMASSGRVLRRQELVDRVWAPEAGVFERTVDTSVKRLRRKLGTAGLRLETVRGVGYRWTDQGGADA